MADVLRIKRRVSGAPGAPASLANAEIAYNEVDHTLYYGEGTGGAGGSATVVVPIGGRGVGSSATPLMDGVATPGTATAWSHGDHVHPVDTSRYAATNPNGYQTAAQVVAVRLDQFAAPTAPVNFNSQAITGLANPTNAQDAATKSYVDAAAQGLDAKGSCVTASTGNLTLSGAQSVDGVAVQTGDRVLVKNQTNPNENGIYTGNTAGAWVRAVDADTWVELVSAFTFVETGAANADSGWLCTVDATGTLGTTGVTWVQFSGAGTINAGGGLTKTGNTLDVVGTAGRISVAADSIDIDATYVGQASITTLGGVTTGTWNASTITVARGGTGAISLTGYVKGNGTGAMTAVGVIPAGDVSGLGTMSSQNAVAVAIAGGTIDGITFDMGTF